MDPEVVLESLRGEGGQQMLTFTAPWPVRRNYRMRPRCLKQADGLPSVERQVRRGTARDRDGHAPYSSTRQAGGVTAATALCNAAGAFVRRPTSCFSVFCGRTPPSPGSFAALGIFFMSAKHTSWIG